MKTKTPLYLTSQTGKTDVWNDSCSIEELNYAIGNGAVGATTNPSIVLNVLKKEMPLWEGRIHELIREMADATEDEIAWKLIEEMACKGAKLLLPAFRGVQRTKRASVHADQPKSITAMQKRSRSRRFTLVLWRLTFKLRYLSQKQESKRLRKQPSGCEY